MANVEPSYEVEVETEFWGPATIEADDSDWQEVSYPQGSYTHQLEIDLSPIEVEDGPDLISSLQPIAVDGTLPHNQYSAPMYDMMSTEYHTNYSMADYSFYQEHHYTLPVASCFPLQSPCPTLPSSKVEETPKVTIVPTSVTNPSLPPPEAPKTTKARVVRRTRLRRRREPARFPCENEGCDRSFSRLFDSQRHHRETHLDERTWVCNDNADNVRKIGLNGCRVQSGGCGKKFKRRSHLRTHLKVAGQYRRAGTFDDTFTPTGTFPTILPSNGEWEGSVTNEGIFVPELPSIGC
ncbi:hypothetical protein BJ508DRAFT_413414 [Ascobolus immersus RN42]|uniref:C2H2-type domain-containing protein n=1 Tax=Ascobolus immersus RN42 TaxID=1160509 RepID=A0A3N4ID47_ASCIM|nr:hypothetical protein BJ508DRAFT_413414 [Ascobolus immersus RN42]